MPSVSYKLTKNLVGLWRWGLVGNNAPDQTNLAGAASVSNMMLGALYGVKLPVGFRLGFFLGATVPIGTGGAGNAAANTGDPSATEATARALAAREGMDNVIWGPNDFAIVPGLDVAYIDHRLTIQVEITIQQAMRVKSETTQADATKTNSTYGLHIGYYVTRWLSVAAELRYQRFLSTPAVVASDPTRRDELSLAIGPRFHIRTGLGVFRPSIAYAPGLTGYLRSNAYHVLLVDLPFSF